jgi:hypothetical protein
MKNYLLFFFITISLTSFAELHKDQWLIGGNAFFSYSKSEELKFVSLQMSPAAGYFFIDKFAGGLRLGINSDTYKYTDEKFRNSTISVAPFLRYYFFPMTNKVNFLLDGSFGFSWSKYKHFTPPAMYAYNSHSFSALAGPAIFLNEHTALEMTLGYAYLSRGPIDSTVTNKFQVGIGLQVHLGQH